MRKMYSLNDDAVKQKIQIMGRYEDLRTASALTGQIRLLK